MYKMNLCKLDDHLKQVGVGRRPVNDPFFSESYEVCNVFRRTGITVEDDEDLCHQVMEEFQCDVLDCDEIFHNLADYEIHYNGTHRYVCEACKITRPNARLLEMHIQETHDSFFDIFSQKQPMYQCYVTECNEKFYSSQDRAIHCATIHKFPKNFDFGYKELKIGNSGPMARKQNNAVRSPESPMEISAEKTLQCWSTRER